MASLFEWLISIVENFIFWNIIDPNEQGVRTFCGKFAKTLDPGLHLSWPIFGQIIITEIVEQVIDVRSQTLTTKDNVSIGTSLSIAYSVDNAYKAIYCVTDRDSSLSNEALRVLGEWIETHTFDACMKDVKMKEVLDNLEDIAKSRWGLHIHRIGRSDFAKAKTIRLMGIGDRYETE